ncbi:S1 family peptidase [Halomonas maura]|uniref:S1 family peptidase n=1 Tax=Halomonas maura TaxID=117606 RepID=UPI0025B440AC|nr:serine protease [Halomonas maura]MDN3556841.1 serine protease [Halomonas maura]
MKKSFQTMIEHPETNSLDRDCKWIRPEFHPIDGIGEEALWRLEGLIVAIGFIDSERQCIIGSGVMIAPGLCLTATHVIEETIEKHPLLFTFPSDSSMRIWTPQDFSAQEKVSLGLLPFQKPEPKYSDVGILSYSPFSKFKDNDNYLFAPIEASVPKIGERLWSTGYREILNDGVPTISFFITSGLVTEQYLEGRGAHINGPCIEVAMQALGGMSGGPVFNVEGRVVGVISSCLEGQDDSKGPTYVSLVWTSLLSTVHSPWPEGHWPEEVAGIQTASNGEGARLLGKARFDEHGAFRVKFPEQTSDSMLSVLKSAGVEFPNEDYEFSDFAYENFEEFLEEEGLKYLSVADKSVFDRALMKKDYSETLKLFNCFDAYIMEGLEDLSIESVSLLDDGNIGINALFDMRIVFLRLQISKVEHEYYKPSITSIGSLHNQEQDEDNIYYDHYARPFYRVNFKYNVQSGECEDIRFQLLSMKV